MGGREKQIKKRTKHKKKSKQKPIKKKCHPCPQNLFIVSMYWFKVLWDGSQTGHSQLSWHCCHDLTVKVNRLEVSWDIWIHVSLVVVWSKCICCISCAFNPLGFYCWSYCSDQVVIRASTLWMSGLEPFPCWYRYVVSGHWGMMPIPRCCFIHWCVQEVRG